MQSLGRNSPLRRDPAPSRWAYRMQRLWLTPLFRMLFRVGVPVVLLAGSAGLVLHDQGRRDALSRGFVDLRGQFEARPEFRVAMLAIEGASPDLSDAVRAKLAVKLPQSSFDLDLFALRLKAEELDAVASAELRVRSGGVLQVVLQERQPVLVWRQADRLELLDATGHRVASLEARADRADLPLIAGEGANLATDQALAILGETGPIADRVRGLVRVGNRRWDLVLDREQRIMLPTDAPVAALERLLALDQADNLLARDIVVIDLRNNQRPVLRLTPFALNEARRASGIIETSENDL